MLNFHRTTEEERYIIGGWKFGGQYSIYDEKPYDGIHHNPKANLFSFYDEDDYIGFINVIDEGEQIFFGIEVNPEFVNKGYGSQMAIKSKDIARELFGAKPMYLEVRTWNKRAVHCYEKAGFVIEGQPFKQTTSLGEGEFYRMIRK